MKNIIIILLCFVSIQSFSQETFVKARKYSIYTDTLRLKTLLSSTSSSDSVLVFRASDSTIRKMAQTDLAGGGAGTDDSAYHRISQLNDSTILFHSNTATDTVVIRGGAAGSGGGGSSTFIGLTDVPATFSGQALKVLRANAGETALEFVTLANGSDYGIIQAATYTLTSTTALQKLFDIGGTGALNVSANTTYEFECFFSLSSMSATSGNCGFDIIGAGTATATNATWKTEGRDGGTLSTVATTTGLFSVNTAETGNIVTASTGTNMYVIIKGTIRINGAGTLIPSINLPNAAAAVTGINSYFKLKAIGDGSVTSW